MRFRAYEPADRAGCLAVYDSNAGDFFSPGDRDELLRFVAAPAGFFGVLADEAGDVAGCGGLAPARAGAPVVVLTWGMVHAGRHGQGLGRLLLLERLHRVLKLPGVEKVVCHTSHLTAGFYGKFGFRDVRVVRDGYRRGLSRHEMELPLTAEVRRLVETRPLVSS